MILNTKISLVCVNKTKSSYSNFYAYVCAVADAIKLGPQRMFLLNRCTEYRSVLYCAFCRQ